MTRLRGVDGVRWGVFKRVTIHAYDDPADAYMHRLRIVETPAFGVMLHHIVRSDHADRGGGYHDHPWSFLSIRLRGNYTEYRMAPSTELDGFWSLFATRSRVSFRRAEDLHRVELDNEVTGCRTLVLHGPRRRVWGFCGPLVPWHPHDAVAGEETSRRPTEGE